MNLQNLVDYCQDLGLEDIFEGVDVPEPLNPEEVKSAIMIRCGLLAPVYSEPKTMRSMIKFWFKSHKWNIEHLINIILADYSPIENFDRYEDITVNRKNKESLSGSDNNVLSGTDSNQYTKNETYQHGHTLENQISAMNSGSYSPDNKEINSGSDTTTDNESNNTTYGKNDTVNYGKVTDNVEDEETKSHLHGNIGVTTNQQMIEQELELLKHFNIYDWIASQVENDLFIVVY